MPSGLKQVSRVTRFFRPNAKHIRPRGATGADSDAPFAWRLNSTDAQKQDWNETITAWTESEQAGKEKREKRPARKGASRASKRRKKKSTQEVGGQADDDPSTSQAAFTDWDADDANEEDFFTIKKPSSTEFQKSSKSNVPPKSNDPTKKEKGSKKKKCNAKKTDQQNDGFVGFEDAFSTKEDLAVLADLNAITTKQFIAEVKRKKNKVKGGNEAKPAPTSKKTQAVDKKKFKASKIFKGAKRGFVFKKDVLGLGYYKDYQGADSTEMGEAAQKPQAKQRGEKSRKEAATTAGVQKEKKQNQQKQPQQQQQQQQSQQKQQKKEKEEKQLAVDLGGGLLVQDTVRGMGKIAAAKGSTVKILYTGSLVGSGKQFDRCSNPNKPFEFQLGASEVISGLDIAMLGMKRGGKRIIVIPPQLGYGRQVLKKIPMNSTLKFKVQLQEVTAGDN